MHAELEDRGVLEIEVAAEYLVRATDRNIRVVAQEDIAKIGNLALRGKPGPKRRAVRQLVPCLDMRTRVAVTGVLRKKAVVSEKGVRVGRVVLGMSADAGEVDPAASPTIVKVIPDPSGDRNVAELELVLNEDRPPDRVLDIHIGEGLQVEQVEIVGDGILGELTTNLNLVRGGLLPGNRA